MGKISKIVLMNVLYIVFSFIWCSSFIGCNIYKDKFNETPDGGENGLGKNTEATLGVGGTESLQNNNSPGIDKSVTTGTQNVGTDPEKTTESNGNVIPPNAKIDASNLGEPINPIDDTDAGDIVSDTEGNSIGLGCGDGRVTGTEKCDIAIASGQPGSCPRQCLPDELCKLWILKGTGCNASCVAFMPECIGGDGCCPSTCDSRNDSDCSSYCGDGEVQSQAGETCEPENAVAKDGNPVDPSIICPTECPDDDDPCTTVSLMGNAENCNVTCESVKTTTVVNGDGCCPEGANASTDNDCVAICGNGIREGDEECDGVTGCNEQCEFTLTTEQQDCIDKYQDPNNSAECDRCMCTNCIQQVINCYGSEDEARNTACSDVVLCGYETSCLGSVCYCGGTADGTVGNCLPGFADGPCKETIERAAGTTNSFTIFFQQIDLNTALGRAQAISDCHSQHCLGICEKTAESTQTNL